MFVWSKADFEQVGPIQLGPIDLVVECSILPNEPNY